MQGMCQPLWSLPWACLRTPHSTLDSVTFLPVCTLPPGDVLGLGMLHALVQLQAQQLLCQLLAAGMASVCTPVVLCNCHGWDLEAEDARP